MHHNSCENDIDNNIVSPGLYGVTIIDCGNGELTCSGGDGQCYECKEEEHCVDFFDQS